MASGNNSSEKIDLLVYGPHKPVIQNGLSNQFELHAYESMADLERLPDASVAGSELSLSLAPLSISVVHIARPV